METASRADLRPRSQDYQAFLESIRGKLAGDFKKGKVATYIPALARVPKTRFAMVVRTIDGQEAAIGDADTTFSIQSVSKVFILLIALESNGGRSGAGLDGNPPAIVSIRSSSLSLSMESRAIHSSTLVRMS